LNYGDLDESLDRLVSKSHDRLVVLPGDGVFGIGSMECELVVVEDVFLAGAHLGVNFYTTFGSMPQKKFPNEPSTPKGS
jgi:hypothetical protein